MRILTSDSQSLFSSSPYYWARLKRGQLALGPVPRPGLPPIAEPLVLCIFQLYYKRSIKLDVNAWVVALHCSVLSAVFESFPKDKGPKVKSVDCLK